MSEDLINSANRAMMSLQMLRSVHNGASDDPLFDEVEKSIRRLIELELKQFALDEQTNPARKQYFAAIFAQREEIMRAFMAKYQCEPDDIWQIEQEHNGGRAWRLEIKRSVPAWTDQPTERGWYWLYRFGTVSDALHISTMVFVANYPATEGELGISENIGGGFSTKKHYIKARDIRGKWLLVKPPKYEAPVADGSFEDMVMEAG
jgi:hypothetical protein